MPVLAARHGDGLVHFPLHRFGNVVAAADHADANVLVHDRRAFFDHVLFEQMHQELEFQLRPLPVLARQAVQRELLDVEPSALFGGAANAGHAAAMALDARQALPLSPAPVAVHDGRDVPRPVGDGHVERFERGSYQGLYHKSLSRFGRRRHHATVNYYTPNLSVMRRR